MTWFWIALIYFYEAMTFLRAEYFMRSPPYIGMDTRGFVFPIRRTWFIAGYDMWIGTYLDRKNGIAYWFPIPFIGMKMKRVAPDRVEGTK